MIPNIRSWKLIGNWRKVFFILPTIPNIDRRISLFEQRTSQEFVYSSSNFHPRFFFRLRFEDARARQVHESTKCTFMQSNCSSKQKIVAFIRQRLQEVWRARKSRKRNAITIGKLAWKTLSYCFNCYVLFGLVAVMENAISLAWHSSFVEFHASDSMCCMGGCVCVYLSSRVHLSSALSLALHSWASIIYHQHHNTRWH